MRCYCCRTGAWGCPTLCSWATLRPSPSWTSTSACPARWCPRPTTEPAACGTPPAPSLPCMFCRCAKPGPGPGLLPCWPAAGKSSPTLVFYTALWPSLVCFHCNPPGGERSRPAACCACLAAVLRWVEAACLRQGATSPAVLVLTLPHTSRISMLRSDPEPGTCRSAPAAAGARYCSNATTCPAGILEGGQSRVQHDTDA